MVAGAGKTSPPDPLAVRWCSRMESNHRPPPYQGGALPTELRERVLQPSSVTARIRPASCRTSRHKHAFPWRRMRLQHPAEPSTLAVNGAGDGNRTRASSLEGYSSTIELLPLLPGSGWSIRRFLRLDNPLETGGGRWIRTTEGVSQQIYSLPPLAAWVSLRLSSRTGFRVCRDACQGRAPPQTLSFGASRAFSFHEADSVKALRAEKCISDAILSPAPGCLPGNG